MFDITSFRGRHSLVSICKKLFFFGEGGGGGDL